MHSATRDGKRIASIDLLIGPYRAGKTYALLRRVVEHCVENPEQGAIVVVPSDRYRKLLRSRLSVISEEVLHPKSEAQSGRGFLGLRIITFYQLCERLLRQFGVFNRLIPDPLRSVLMSRVLMRLQERGRIQSTASIVDYPGTVGALLSLVDELERSASLPEEILVRLKRAVSGSSRYVERAEIYQGYWQALNAVGYLDKRQLAYKLIDALNANVGRKTEQLGMVAFDGFDRLNPLQLKVIAALAQSTEKVLVSFDYLDPKHDQDSEYLWKESSYAQLKKVLGSGVNWVQFNDGSGNGRTQTAQARVETFLAPDRYFEMTEIARRIKEAANHDPRQLNGFLVVSRSLQNYKSAVQAAFQDAQIDYFIDEAVELRALPVVQFLMRTLALKLNGYIRSEILFCLRSQYFKLSAFGLSSKTIDELDRISLAATVVGGQTQWQEAVSAQEMGYLGTKLATVFSTLAPSEAVVSAEQHVHWVEDVIAKVLLLPGEDESVDPFQRWEQESALIQFRGALSQLIDEQELNAKFGYLTEISYAEFFKQLEKLIEGANFRTVPRTKNYVLVCAAELAPNQVFDEVFIAGLAEGEFPKRALQNGFVNAQEVANWSNFDVDIHNPRQHPNFETALFKSLLKRAKHRVVLSCPAASMSGQELTPSSLLDETSLSDQQKLQMVQPLESLRFKPTSPRNALAGILWQNRGSRLPDKFAGNVNFENIVHDMAEPLLVARARLSGVGDGPLNGYLADYVAVGRVAVSLPKAWSASSLGDYGKCPFRYWVSHILDIRPLQEPKEGLTPFLLGDTYHKALEIFYSQLIASRLSITEGTEEKLQELLTEATEQAIAYLEARSDFRADEFWDFRQKEIYFRLKRFVEHERLRALKATDRFVPIKLEASFGFDDSESGPPLKVVGDADEILLRGRVDRVDVASSSHASESPRVRVIDYKSGSSTISAGEALAGRNLQLPVYILAVENSLMPKSKVVEAAYLSVVTGEPIGRIQFENQRGGRYDPYELLDKTKEHIVNFVSGIKQGDFAVRPNGAKVCDKCEHQIVCRITELKRVGSDGDGEDSYVD